MDDRLDIRTLEHLANRLGYEVRKMAEVAQHVRKYYRCFSIERKGKVRPVRQATGALATLQGRISDLLQTLAWPEEFQGGIKQRSARTNAARHVGASHALQSDIKDFFPSVRPEMVYGAFVGFGCSPDVARMLTRLTTFEHRVPQGARSSTMVANLVLWHRTFARAAGAAAARSATLTLYVDDLTVSGQRSLAGLQSITESIFEQSGLPVKPEKTVVGVVTDRTVVTGYCPTSAGLTMPRGYVLQVEQEIEDLASSASTLTAVEREKRERSIRGRIRYVGTADPESAAHLFERLTLALATSPSQVRGA